MPASARSLAITDRYRASLHGLSDRAEAVARARWTTVRPDAIDETAAAWLDGTTPLLDAFQRAGIQLSAAYLAAFITSETGRAQTPRRVDEAVHAGIVDGSPLGKALDGARIVAKTRISEGEDAGAALLAAAAVVTRLAVTAVMGASRAALGEQIGTHREIIGWRRVTSGGCGACLASATGVIEGARKPLRVHDHCRCTAEPVVRGVPDLHHRPTGRAIFDGMTPEQQDSSLGPAAAGLIRSGEVPFERLIAVSPMRMTADQITQAPLEALVGEQ